MKTAAFIVCYLTAVALTVLASTLMILHFGSFWAGMIPLAVVAGAAGLALYAWLWRYKG